MDAPTIFISSTIYDFRDLRSALKDHLERRGCQVLASEFNDFTKPLDKHSYDACLQAIEKADIFVLLIGARVGGWYNEGDRTSITQMEYRKAYELAQAGRLRILSFVRGEVWDHRQSTKELAQYLETLTELDDTLRRKIAKYPTALASDAEFIVSFIDEVSRNKETSAAVKGKGKLPVANWVHQFSSFADIRTVIDPLILHGLNVKDAAGRRALQNQLLTLLRDVVPLINDKAFVPAPTIRKLALELNLTTEKMAGNVRIDRTTWDRLVFVSIYTTGLNIGALQLSSFLSTDLLLEYDSNEGVFKQTQSYDVLTDLVDQIKKFGRARSNFDPIALLKHSSSRAADGSVLAPGHLVVMQLQILFRWADIAMLAKALALAMENQPLKLETPMPLTPFLDEQQLIAKEQVSIQKIREFVGLGEQLKE